MSISDSLQTTASIIGILFTLEQAYQRLRHIPIETANRWLTSIYDCQEIVNSVKATGGNLGMAWQIGDRSTSENELFLKLDEIRNSSRNRKIRSASLKLQESLRKIWASAQPLVPVVYFLDDFDQIQSSTNEDLTSKFQALQLDAAVSGDFQVKELVRLIQKRRAKV